MSTQTEPSSAQQPVVRIEIGRIEVSAPVPAPTPPVRKPRRSAPAMSLDDYLRGASR